MRETRNGKSVGVLDVVELLALAVLGVLGAAFLLFGWVPVLAVGIHFALPYIPAILTLPVIVFVVVFAVAWYSVGLMVLEPYGV